MFHPTLKAGLENWRNAPRHFVALLAALQFRNADLEAMRQLDASEWEELLFFSDRTHFTLLLSRLPSGVLPAYIASRIQRNLADNTRRVEQIKMAYAEIADAMRQKNADHLVIKGFTQYPAFVESPNLRMQLDIDIFCPPHSILQARDALMKLGYLSSPFPAHTPEDHLPLMIRKGDWRWRGNAFDPIMPPGIELHYCLWNEPVLHFGISDVDQFWYRRVEREINGVHFPALHPVDDVAFCSLQILRDVLHGFTTLHRAYELAYFLHTHGHDSDFWSRWKRSHTPALRCLEAISMRLAQVWFHCDLPAEAEEAVCELPPAIHKWFRYFSLSPVEGIFRPNRDGVWLHVALVNSPGAGISIARRALLPARVPSFDTAERNTAVDFTRWSPRPRSRFTNYARYVAARMNYYACVFSRGIWRGSRWWWSQRRFGTR